MLDLKDNIFCVVERDDFTNSWFNFAKGGELNPTYVDFFLNQDSALSVKRLLESQNPETEFDVMKTEYQSFVQHWTRSEEWTND